ncbi:hypothetical protein IH779_02530 [Patescibacteria group bacterium]|nr:hypothetical protein [Patescibacteria group bacterium]
MTIKIICADCGKEIGKKEGEVEGGITHSTCRKCTNAFNEKTRLIKLARELAKHSLK